VKRFHHAEQYSRIGNKKPGAMAGLCRVVDGSPAKAASLRSWSRRPGRISESESCLRKPASESDGTVILDGIASEPADEGQIAGHVPAVIDICGVGDVRRAARSPASIQLGQSNNVSMGITFLRW